jgi:hypothetical protein
MANYKIVSPRKGEWTFEKGREQEEGFAMKKILAYAVIPLVVVAMLYFAWKATTYGERNPEALNRFVGEERNAVEAYLKEEAKNAEEAAAKALVVREPRTSACRQLPAYGQWQTSPLWGKNAYGQAVSFQPIIPELLTNEKQFEIWNLVMRINQTQEPKMSPRSEIPHALLERVEQAQEKIRAIKRLPCAYQWEIVRGIAELYGPYLILRDHGSISRIASFDGRAQHESAYLDQRKISDETAFKENAVTFAVRMVEVATAMVFARSISVQSGYMPDTLETLRTICVPFNTSYTGFEEAAVLWNRGRFLEAVQEAPHPDITMIRELDNGRSIEFLARVVRRAEHMESLYEEGERSMGTHVGCRYPPRTEGPFQGMELLPAELDDPMIHFLNAEFGIQTTRLLAVR